jgi:hypothetical protein
MVAHFPPKYEIFQRLMRLYKETREFGYTYILWTEIFGSPDIFIKLSIKKLQAKTIKCPQCGKTGQIKEKTTVTKKKYKYSYLYVYHGVYDQRREAEKLHKPTHGIRKYWCFLNYDNLTQPVIQDALRKLAHWQNIEKYFYKSLFLPDS